MFKKVAMLSAVILCGASSISIPPAVASEKVAIGDRAMGYTTTPPNAANCKMMETVNLSVNFANVTVKLENASAYLKEKIAEAEALAREVGIQKIETNNSYYNINPQYNQAGGCSSEGGDYTLSGNFAFTLDNMDQAVKLAKKLEEKSFTISISSSAYRQCQ